MTTVALPKKINFWVKPVIIQRGSTILNFRGYTILNSQVIIVSKNHAEVSVHQNYPQLRGFHLLVGLFMNTMCLIISIRSAKEIGPGHVYIFAICFSNLFIICIDMTFSIWRYILQQPISLEACVIQHFIAQVALPVIRKYGFR